MKKIKSKLLEIGLSDLETNVYLLLCDNSSLTVDAICQNMVMNKKQMLSVLAKLNQIGFCNEISDKKKHYKAVNPSIAIPIYLDLQIDLLKLQKKEIILPTKNFAQFYNEYAKNENDNYSAIYTKKSFNQFYKKLLATTKSSIRYLVNQPVLLEDQDMYEHIFDIENITRRKIDVFGIYEYESNLRSENKIIIETLLQLGQQIRISESLPFDLLIFDEKELLFRYYESVNDAHLFAFYSSNEVVVSKFVKFYNLYWENSKNFESIKKNKKQEEV